MAIVKECRQCKEINRPDAAICKRGHDSFSLVAVERPDYIICTNCGDPTPAQGAVCSACGHSLSAPDARDLAAAFYTKVLTTSKLAERNERVGDYLKFVQDGLEVSIDLVPADSLEVPLRYYAAELKPLPRNTFSGPIDRSQFLTAANSLNASLGDVKIFLGGSKEVWFQCSNPLFFNIAEQPADGQLKPEQLEPIFPVILRHLLPSSSSPPSLENMTARTSRCPSAEL